MGVSFRLLAALEAYRGLTALLCSMSVRLLYL